MGVRYLISFAILGLSVIVQTTILRFIAISGVIPDLSLIIIIFLSNKNGRMLGQVSGFFTGIIEDFLSLAPLGFHALIRTIIGFLYGITKGVIFTDPILMPIVLVAIGTFLKSILVGITAAIFSIESVAYGIFSSSFFIELGYNAILAPLIFALMKLIKRVQPAPGKELV